MKIRLTQSYVRSLKSPVKPYWISDAGCSNLRLYVGGTVKVWYVLFREEGNPKKQSHKLGNAGEVLTVSIARDMANDFTARLKRGESPHIKNAPKENMTAGEFIETHYKPWLLANRRSGKATHGMIRSSFWEFFKVKLTDLTTPMLETWRETRRRDKGVKNATLNRLCGALKSAFNWGVQRGVLDTNPINLLKPLKESDSDPRVRYLSPEERARLMAALDSREERVRQARERHNKWLEARGKPLMPRLSSTGYADYLKPLVLTALNTGVRRNGLLSLLWGDVDLNGSPATILLRAASAKSERSQRLPLNSTVCEILSKWKLQNSQTESKDLVFPSPKNGGKMRDCKNAWNAALKDAQLENFRFHDLRHDFASQLVKAGKELNKVRALLTHADLKTTLKYAHLAPEDLLETVEALVEKKPSKPPE